MTKVTIDSRQAETGILFIALPGAEKYITQAREQGAIAVADNGSILNDIFNYPAKSLKLIAVTGTNGKTSTAWILYHSLRALSKKAMSVGTLGVMSENINFETGYTTPDILQNYSLLAEAIEQGVEYVVMEVSSHALSQNRVLGLSFDCAVFTNLTRDHLDYHKDFEDYYLAKKSLFSQLKQQHAAVINSDCKYGQRLIKELSEIQQSTYAAEDLSAFASHPKLHGKHNQYNLAAAAKTLEHFGFSKNQIHQALDSVPSVPGRLEAIDLKGIKVFIDYAHTPDALKNVLQALRPLAQKKLWVIFGCGGDRDPGKRPEMAQVAEELADKVVVTSDNPRTEDPQKIIDDILAGCTPEFTEVCRKTAIQKTLKLAREGDLVLIAGKGHEEYQIIGKDRVAFSDREVVLSC